MVADKMVGTIVFGGSLRSGTLACWGPVGGHRGPMHTYCSQGPWS